MAFTLRGGTKEYKLLKLFKGPLSKHSFKTKIEISWKFVAGQTYQGFLSHSLGGSTEGIPQKQKLDKTGDKSKGGIFDSRLI